MPSRCLQRLDTPLPIVDLFSRVHIMFLTIAHVLDNIFLFHVGDLEAMAFKKAMGRLMASLKEDDVKKLITFLYSDDIIDKSTRDHLQSLLPHHSELVRVYNVLCCLESIIQKRPQVYGQLIEIFLNRLQLSSPGIILRKWSCLIILCAMNLEI